MTKPQLHQYFNWIPGQGLPTKGIDSQEEAFKEADRLERKTGKTVYILQVQAIRHSYVELDKMHQAKVLKEALCNETITDEMRRVFKKLLNERFSEYVEDVK